MPVMPLGDTQMNTSVPAGADRLHLFAVYGAFATIALIVFGTISFHPF